MELKNTIKLTAALALAATLAACGGGSGSKQDSGTRTDHILAARAVDGYLARALVFADYDGDTRLDPFEPRARTDSNGFFGKNPLTGADYCAAPEDAPEASYCLRVPVAGKDAIVRISGGFDLSTESAFDGMLSYDPAALGALDGGVVISPLTTLLSSAGGRAAELAVLVGLHDPHTELRRDYIGEFDLGLTESALGTHKVVTVLSDLLSDHYRRIGDEDGLPGHASTIVYDALAEELLESGSYLHAVLLSEARLQNVLRRAEQSLRESYRAAALNLPAALDGARIAERALRARDVAEAVVQLVGRGVQANPTQAQFLGSARAVEVLVRKITQNTTGAAGYERAAAAFAADPRAVEQLGTGSFDLSRLVNAGFTVPNNDRQDAEAGKPGTMPGTTEPPREDQPEEEVKDEGSAVKPPQPPLALTQLAGSTMRLDKPEGDETGAVQFYFIGEPGARSGRLRACLRYADTDPGETLYNTDGTYLTGSWEQIGDYTILMTVRIFLVLNEELVVRSVAMGDNGTPEFSFDFNGKDGYWAGAYPTAYETLPTSNTQCRNLLRQ